MVAKYGYYSKFKDWNTLIIPIIGHASASYRLPGQANKTQASGIIDPILVLGASRALDNKGKLRLGFSQLVDHSLRRLLYQPNIKY